MTIRIQTKGILFVLPWLLLSGLTLAAPEEGGSLQQARAQIDQLLGPLVRISKGSYVRRSMSNLDVHVAIDHDQWASKYALNWKRYCEAVGTTQCEENKTAIRSRTHLTLNRPEVFLSDSKPVMFLSRQDEGAYFEVLNEKLKTLWPQAYPGTETPRFSRSTEFKREYLETRPLNEPRSVSILGASYVVTAELRKYPGADDPSQLPPQRQMRDGPYDVDAPELENGSNDRGLVGLVRGVREITDSRYSVTNHALNPNENGEYYATRGSNWFDGDLSIYNSSGFVLGAEPKPNEYVGLRPSADIREESSNY